MKNMTIKLLILSFCLLVVSAFLYAWTENNYPMQGLLILIMGLFLMVSSIFSFFTIAAVFGEGIAKLFNKNSAKSDIPDIVPRIVIAVGCFIVWIIGVGYILITFWKPGNNW